MKMARKMESSRKKEIMLKILECSCYRLLSWNFALDTGRRIDLYT